MALTRPYPVDKAFPNASDIRKEQAAIFPREGLFPDPITVANAGVAYAASGWAVGARPFAANLKRKGAAFTQAYGSAQIANDATESAAWLLPGAPSSGSRTSLLWVRADDPTQGEGTEQVAGEVGPDGLPRPRALPRFGITTGTTTVAPVLPAGALRIATVVVTSAATSAATSLIVNDYTFANVLGGPIFYRTEAALKADSDVAQGETGYAIATGARFTRGAASWGGFDPAYAQTRQRTGSDNTFAAGTMADIFDGSATVPAGLYFCDAAIVVYGSQLATCETQLTASSTVGGGGEFVAATARDDISLSPRPLRTSGLYRHTGGVLRVLASARVGAGTPTVMSAGTKVTFFRIGD